MAKDNILSERVRPISEACAPLKVKVTLLSVRDKYYIHFDGTKTYQTASDWDKYWISFEKYVIHLLKTNGFPSNAIKIKKDCYAVCFVGTLFDFLCANKEDE